MGKVSEYSIELHDILQDLEEIAKLLDQLKAIELPSIVKLNVSQFVKIYNNVLDELSSSSMNQHLLNYARNFIIPLYSDLKNFILNPNSEYHLKVLLDRFKIARDNFRSISYIVKDSFINSEEYYNNKISELQGREAVLKKALELKVGQSQEKIKKAELEVEEAKRKIQEYEQKLELKKKEDDARINWEGNINKTFNELKNYLSPIINEKQRLNILFWTYLILSGLIVAGVIIIEWIAIHKIYISEKFPDFKQYITIFLPVPVAGALLWGFIYQMNRAQRQLVIIAKSIHNIEYIQGLLLSINKLAPTIEDGINRINIALDKLISNHLGQKEINTEEELIKEDKKDSLSIDSVINLLKELKGLTKKE